MSTEKLCKFTIIGHASLYIESKDTRLLIDPWLIGSCYWRSWWNYPPINQDTIRDIDPTHIYLSHLHWDHYHGPSLRKFYDSDPIILLPKAATTRMKTDMEKDFKFTRIHEMRHAWNYSLGEDFSVCSYQFNPFIIDSSLAISCNGVQLLNANDSKIFGLSLRQVITSYRYFDFVFRSHSSASPIPYCVEGVDPYKTSRSPKDYTNEFISFAEACNAKYAIPFASSHAYLHEGSKKYNDFYNNPSMILDRYSHHNTQSKCVIMPSGSTWSTKDGFHIAEKDYGSIKKDIKLMIEDHKASLEKEYKRINRTRVDEKALSIYFQSFNNALPKLLPRLRFGFFLVRDVNLDNKHSLGDLVVIDSKKGNIEIMNDWRYCETINREELELAFIIKTYANVINDCSKKKMFNTFTPSKLLRIHPLGKGNSYKLYLQLIDMYENEALPLHNLLSKRQVRNRLARWRELIDIIVLVYTVKIKRMPYARLWGRLEKEDNNKENGN